LINSPSLLLIAGWMRNVSGGFSRWLKRPSVTSAWSSRITAQAYFVAGRRPLMRCARHRDFCGGPRPGRGGRARRPHDALEQWAGRGPDHPPQVDQAHEVWPRHFRPLTSPVAASFSPPDPRKMRESHKYGEKS
jgi:hypothetical protein